MPGEKQYYLQEGILYYTEGQSRAEITRYEGTAARLQIPDRIGDLPVTAVGRKAFWNSRDLLSVSLPDTVEEIGDWAFASCRILQEAKLPGKNLRLGRKIFQNSFQLKKIFFRCMDPLLARLTAAAVVGLDAPYLLDPAEAGSRKWFCSLDARILEILHESEEIVLKNLVYCAEEDMLEKQEMYLRQRSYQKAETALLRLICPEGLEQSVQSELSGYLCKRTKGCLSEAAWEVIKRNREEQIPYCAKMIEIGGINRYNIDDVLSDLDDMQVELKAYLLKQRPQMAVSSEIWKTLEL